MANRFLKLAALYLVLGVTLGLAMGMSQKFTLAPVHAHLGLLGWVSMALAGLIYLHHPAAAQTKLAAAHFWLHNLALPPFMAGLALVLMGEMWAGPLLGIGSAAVWLGLVLFAVNLWRALR